MKRRASVVGLVVGGILVLGGSVEAQWRESGSGWCDDHGRRDRERHCFILTEDFDAPGRIAVDGGANGGVTVEGWSRDVVEVRAKVWADARDPERARSLARAVEPRMSDGRLTAEGPDTDRGEHWGVSWEVMVPETMDLDIETRNGGIAVANVSGRIDFRAVNGGVHLTEVGGDVRGRTTNGGVHVELDGRRWDGQGLDVETTNGGVTLRVPADYSARLETGTVNGGIDIDFPVTIQGRVGRRLETTLGEGGPPVRVVTTNGGVRISRGQNAIR